MVPTLAQNFHPYFLVLFQDLNQKKRLICISQKFMDLSFLDKKAQNTKLFMMSMELQLTKIK